MDDSAILFTNSTGRLCDGGSAMQPSPQGVGFRVWCLKLAKLCGDGCIPNWVGLIGCLKSPLKVAKESFEQGFKLGVRYVKLSPPLHDCLSLGWSKPPNLPKPPFS